MTLNERRMHDVVMESFRKIFANEDTNDLSHIEIDHDSVPISGPVSVEMTDITTDKRFTVEFNIKVHEHVS